MAADVGSGAGPGAGKSTAQSSRSGSCSGGTMPQLPAVLPTWCHRWVLDVAVGTAAAALLRPRGNSTWLGATM